MTAEFSQLLSQLLYGQPDLRPAILKALKKMVDLNAALADSIEDEAQALSKTLSQEDAQGNLAYLRTQVESWLAVLFNVYGSVNRDSRALIGDVINSWALIAGDEVSRTYFRCARILIFCIGNPQRLSESLASLQGESPICSEDDRQYECNRRHRQYDHDITRYPRSPPTKSFFGRLSVPFQYMSDTRSPHLQRQRCTKTRVQNFGQACRGWEGFYRRWSCHNFAHWFDGWLDPCCQEGNLFSPQVKTFLILWFRIASLCLHR